MRYLIATLLVMSVTLVGAVTQYGARADNSALERRANQLAAGIHVWEMHCARCHDFSRPRMGTERLAMRIGARELAWHGTTAQLMHYVEHYMPFDKPNTLAEQEYLDVVAYLLARSELLPLGVEVSRETLGAITLPPYLGD